MTSPCTNIAKRSRCPYFEKLAEDFWLQPVDEFATLKDWAPRADLSETSDAWKVNADLPGVKKEDIKVEINKGILEISGTRASEFKEEDEKNQIRRVERSFCSFKRSWTLPENITEEGIDAHLENGVLQVTIPKKYHHPTPKKSITIRTKL